MAHALGRVCSLVARDGESWVVGAGGAASGVDGLADALYAHWYTQPVAGGPSGTDDPPLNRRSLLGALRAAQARRPTPSDGWTVTASDPRGVVSAARSDDARILKPGEYVMPLRPGVPPAPGEPIELVGPLNHLEAERGLWWAFTVPGPEPPIGRIYLDARPATAPRVVHEVTAALLEVPFQLKCPILADACRRVDTVVVYHARGSRDVLLEALGARWPVLGALLDPAVPPLTCHVRPGLAWADDADGGRSYGESRCHALAAAIEGAAAAWPTMGHDQRLATLAAALVAAGLDPQRPWEAPA